METYRGRKITENLKVFVYRNLHTNNFSIKAMEGFDKGKVVGHAERISLKDCTFTVQEKGRKRVLATKHKNVHAGVIGRIVFVKDEKCKIPITYNPYLYTTFVKRNNKEPIFKSEFVEMRDLKVYAK